MQNQVGQVNHRAGVLCVASSARRLKRYGGYRSVVISLFRCGLHQLIGVSFHLQIVIPMDIGGADFLFAG